jgi:hypothetical protein
VTPAYSPGSTTGDISKEVLIRNSVTFLLTGAGFTSADYDALLASITDVRFQFGTTQGPLSCTISGECTPPATTTPPDTVTPPATVQPDNPPTPEPASMVLLGTGLVAIATRLRKARRKDQQIL